MAWLNTDELKPAEGGDKPKAIFAVDFDDTIVEGLFPGIGKPNPGAAEVLQELTKKGYRLILNTMRTGKELNEAIVYCNASYINFWGINENPEQHKWAPDSKKIFAHVYIDNAGLGTPLMKDSNGKPCVDWVKVRELLVAWEVLDAKEPGDGTKTFDIK